MQNKTISALLLAGLTVFFITGCTTAPGDNTKNGTTPQVLTEDHTEAADDSNENQAQYETRIWNFTDDSIGLRYEMPENSLQRRQGRSVSIPGTLGDIWLMVGYLTKDAMNDLQINLNGKTEEALFMELKEAFMGTVYDTLHDSGDTEDTEITVASQERVQAGKFNFIKTVGTMSYNGGKLGGDPWEHKFICYTTQLSHYDNAPVWIMVMDCSKEQDQSEAEMDIHARMVCESVREITNDTLDPEVIE